MDRLESAGSAYPAPELDVDRWFGGEPTSLAQLRGRVVMIEAFQMLCPGCLSYGLPQAQRVHRQFPEVAVIGLHTVFEHHGVTGPDALAVFLSEFGIPFPVAVDRHDGQRMPVTMRAYDLQGTPSTVLIDKAGNLRLTHLGALAELSLGAMLGELLAEPAVQ
ncbi:peroxiredoxin family protein [Microbacterium luticocti]|uniref:peroxiredoxin family protein n=1 Tax=Microbacterium luticocti TaxID=451764 RepID=UPI00040BCD94|nr:TlpA disulfide reductase family protein [Microbacterium luticocti]